METLAKHDVRGTVALNGEVGRDLPRIMEEATRLNWQLMGHGLTNSVRRRRPASAPGSEATAVRDAAGGNHRNARRRIDDRRHKRKCAPRYAVTAALRALRNQNFGAAVRRSLLAPERLHLADQQRPRA